MRAGDDGCLPPRSRVWAGTEDGLYQFDGAEWRAWTEDDGLATNEVHSLLLDRGGHVWAGTTDGVSRFDGSEWVTWRSDDGLGRGLVRSLLLDNSGQVWAGTRQGVSRSDGAGWTTWTKAHGLADNIVDCLLQDHSGVIWVAGPGGVSRFSPGATAVESGQVQPTPGLFSLAQNYPNPFNSGTLIGYTVPNAGDVELAVYALTGQRVATLVQGALQGGRHSTRWDGLNDQGEPVASGVYLCRLRVGEWEQARKLLLTR